MPNTITPVDVYRLFNDFAKILFGGQTTMQAVDTKTFATVGEAALRQGEENILDALTVQLTRTIFAIRPYQGAFHSIESTSQEYGLLTRKISYFYDGFEASRDWNTDLNPKQLVDGQSIDHYVIKKRYPLEMYFGGIKTLQKHFTRFRKQLKIAFRNADEYERFYQGLAVEINNEIGMKREMENRLTVLNYIGGLYNIGTAHMKRNLTALFNARYNTTYTSEQLRTEHLKEFLAFLVVQLKTDTRMMERMNTMFHITPNKTDDRGNPLTLLRHTPRSIQRLLLYAPLFYEAEAKVFPTIFNTEYLRTENYEGVDYWQNPELPSAVSVIPNQFSIATGKSEDGAQVDIPYVVGILYDRPALVTSYMYDDVNTTPVNAAADYYNTYYHWAKDYQNDFTENGILYYMADPEAETNMAAMYGMPVQKIEPGKKASKPVIKDKE